MRNLLNEFRKKYPVDPDDWETKVLKELMLTGNCFVNCKTGEIIPCSKVFMKKVSEAYKIYEENKDETKS